MPAVGVLGTGQVGQAIARRAAEVGYTVTVGARSARSGSLGVFADAAYDGDAIRDRVRREKARACIRPNPTRKRK